MYSAVSAVEVFCFGCRLMPVLQPPPLIGTLHAGEAATTPGICRSNCRSAAWVAYASKPWPKPELPNQNVSASFMPLGRCMRSRR